jgi:serine/threonine protein kinase
VAQRLLHPESTAAIILGASDWSECGLGPAPSFRRSGKGFLSYLVDTAGLGLDPELVLDLFDDPASAGDQLGRLRDTLDGLLRERREMGRPVADVVVYYVGHGTTDDQGHLSLLVRRSRKGLESETGIRAPDLARVLRISAPQQRRLVVLDCCFAEAAVRAFVGMGAPEQAVAAGVAKDIAEALPGRGGLLLCSSQMGEVSVGHPAADRTLFTGAMLRVLRDGVDDREPFLSFSDVCDEAYRWMLDGFGVQAPRPVLHAINQVHGDLTRLPAFPNSREANKPGGFAARAGGGTPRDQSADGGNRQNVRDQSDARMERRLQLISKWATEEVIPEDDLEFVLSAALGELDGRAAALVQRVLDSPSARASALMAVLVGIEEATLSRKSPTTASRQPTIDPNDIWALPKVEAPAPRNAQILTDVVSRQLPSFSPDEKGDTSREKLGKYIIRRLLGRGALGQVYEAWDPVLARQVAIKTVKLPESGEPETEEGIARFRREAQAAARLIHPNIVGVFDYGETDDLAYIVMELVDGEPLKRLLDQQERFAIAGITNIMEGVLAGLEFIHQRGVVHRDIKPGNVMLTKAGLAKIADFGIARIESSTMTQQGTLLGTPAYMSPEQFMGHTVDARTDIYSSGVLLYQLLTGERPFDGGLSSIMHKALNTEPPWPSQISVTAPQGLDAVVKRAMAKRPEDRFTTATEFLDALHAALGQPIAASEAEENASIIEAQSGNSASGNSPPGAKAIGLRRILDYRMFRDWRPGRAR